jgi:hypothetical protein
MEIEDKKHIVDRKRREVGRGVLEGIEAKRSEPTPSHCKKVRYHNK